MDQEGSYNDSQDQYLIIKYSQYKLIHCNAWIVSYGFYKKFKFKLTIRYIELKSCFFNGGGQIALKHK